MVRPADANETAACWQAILEHTDRPAGHRADPTERPDVPARRRRASTTPATSTSGGYVLLDADGEGLPDVVLVGTGSEVQLAVEARDSSPRRASAPGSSRCRAASGSTPRRTSYRETVIPPTVKARVSVEAGVAQGWREVVGDHGRIVSLEHYGASADYARIYREFGVTARGRRRRCARTASGRHRLTRRRDTHIPVPGGGNHDRPTAGSCPTRGCRIWLDDLSRERIETGNLAELVKDKHVVGVTTNPTIFANALADGERYNDADPRARRRRRRRRRGRSSS